MNWVTIYVGDVLRTTDAALLCDVGGREVWIPRSQVDGADDWDTGSDGEMQVTRFIAERLELDYEEEEVTVAEVVTRRRPPVVPRVTVPALSEEQDAAVRHLIQNVGVNQVQTLGGFAGTGKTTCLTALHHHLSDWAVVAFTGKAADILRRKGLPGETIHSTIYEPVKNSNPVRFRLKHRDELGSQVRGFLIDEASMVGSTILRDVKSFGRPVIAVGDHGQLPPVGDDAGLMRNPDVRLETIHRNAGPIARFAEHLRKGGSPGEWDGDAGGNRGEVRVVHRKSLDRQDLLDANQIICAFNKTRVKINRYMRTNLGRDGDDPVIGDRVMCLRNDRATGVFNGQQGTCQGLNGSENRMLFRPDFAEPLWVSYHPHAWNKEKAPAKEFHTPGEDIPFDFCYAVTCHKFQGDEHGRIIVVEEKCPLWEHARWAYTAASRARGSLVWAI